MSAKNAILQDIESHQQNNQDRTPPTHSRKHHVVDVPRYRLVRNRSGRSIAPLHDMDAGQYALWHHGTSVQSHEMAFGAPPLRS